MLIKTKEQSCLNKFYRVENHLATAKSFIWKDKDNDRIIQYNPI